jgi:pimeloyl-ACP methyl ester carboxylesterase
MVSAVLEAKKISAAFPYQKQGRRVLGREMAYVEVGEGDPIVLLHGNPTSSYLWRNVLPHLQGKLPDSGPGSYRFVEHRHYLDALLEALNVRERLDWPNARRVQLDFFYDYRTNVALYPKWQASLREKKPNTIIFWGQDDIFFTREGGESYLEDLPNAEMHRLNSGHFAVEDNLDYIAKNMKRFYQQSVAR